MYLGHERFVALARKHGATIAVKPMNLGEVFPVSGGLPLAKRAPQRQAYRLVELKRWSEFLSIPLNLHPKYFPANGDPAACWILAAAELGTEQALAMTGAVGRAVWAQERDIADAATLAAIARRMRTRRREARRRAPRRRTSSARYAALTQEAIDARRVRRADVRRRRRTVLGTGPARLPGPQTGKIACFLRSGPPGRQGKGEFPSGRTARS